MNGEAQSMEGNSAIGIDRSCEPETEDIIEGLVGFGHDKRPEERALLPQRVCKSHMRNLLSRGVNPLKPILGEFPVEHLPRLLDCRDSVRSEEHTSELQSP